MTDQPYRCAPQTRPVWGRWPALWATLRHSCARTPRSRPVRAVRSTWAAGQGPGKAGTLLHGAGNLRDGGRQLSDPQAMWRRLATANLYRPLARGVRLASGRQRTPSCWRPSPDRVTEIGPAQIGQTTTRNGPRSGAASFQRNAERQSRNQSETELGSTVAVTVARISARSCSRSTSSRSRSANAATVRSAS
jgi:hypothetical protein